MKTKVFTNKSTVLVLFPVGLHLGANVEFGQIPISNLVIGSRTKNCDVVVVVLKLVFFLKGLFPLLCGYIEAQFLIIFGSDPLLGFDFRLNGLDKIKGFLKGNGLCSFDDFVLIILLFFHLLSKFKNRF